MEPAVDAHLAQRRDQPIVNRIILVGVGRQIAGAAQILEPLPLHHCRFQQRSRRIGVELEQLGRTPPVIGKIEPAVEIAIPEAPAFGYRRPEIARNCEPGQRPLVTDQFAGRFIAEREQFLARRLDVVFNLVEGEAEADRLIPIGNAAYAVKGEAYGVAFLAPVRARQAGFAQHVYSPPEAPWPDAPKPPRETVLVSELLPVETPPRLPKEPPPV